MDELDMDALALNYACEYCHALAGVHCITEAGNKAKNMHQVRLEPLYTAFGWAYHQGWQEGCRHEQERRPKYTANWSDRLAVR